MRRFLSLKRLLIAALILAFSAASAYAYMRPPSPIMATSVVKVQLTSGHGSGVHIGNGYIVTAAHVVAATLTATDDAGKSVTLKTSDGKTRPVDVLWINAAYDLALLRTSADGLEASPLDCRTAIDGELIKASGNPTSLEFVSAYGHVTGAAREEGPWKTVLVTDMTVVMGMSGGPTFSEDGHVIGITVGVLSAMIPGGMLPQVSLTGFGMMVPSSAVCLLLGRE